MQSRPTVLVPIRVLEGESLPDGVPQLLAHAHVVLLGYHVVPEQTAPGQAQMQFEDRAIERLMDFEEMFEQAGATVERRLVFTHEAQTTIDRTIHEHDCLAVLVPDTLANLDDVLVAVRGTVGLDRIGRLVAGLFADTDAEVTLYHIASEIETDADTETLLQGLTDRLRSAGVADSLIRTRVERDRKPIEAISEASAEYDVVVMGESDPSLATFVFGLPAEQVAKRFLGPVLVVQRERPPDESERT
ncbi:MAG: universal stress protein [Halodesulfurarchaeum sp.]